MVYLGKIIPKYALSNYRAISKNFPDYQTWFIVDEESNFEELRRVGINSWLVPKIINDFNTQRSTYRNGFWLNTTNRFYAMEEFHKANPDFPILQIESDVVISRSFPMQDFSSINESFAFPMSSPTVGLASTLWCKNAEATRSLADFSRDCVSGDPKLTDTDILGLLAINRADEVLVLRSGPDNPKAYRSKVDGNKLTLRGANHQINEFGIFDASTIGIHLCGSDPRNSFGISHVFDPLIHHFMDISTLDFMIEGSDIYLTIGGEKRLIYSIHNHSKQDSFFRGDFARELESYLDKRADGQFQRFSLYGLIKCLEDYWNLLRNKIRFSSRGGQI